MAADYVADQLLTQSNGGMAQATCAASLLTIKGTAEQALNAPADARDGYFLVLMQRAERQAVSKIRML